MYDSFKYIYVRLKFFSVSRCNDGGNSVSAWHIRCMCHVVNIAAKASLLTLCNELSKIRQISKRLRKSSKFRDAFAFHFQQHAHLTSTTLPLDTPTRWNSCLDMLARALELRVGVDVMATEHHDAEIRSFFNQQKLSTQEWDVIQSIVSFLKPFKRITVQLSEEHFPSLCSAIPSFLKLLDTVDAQLPSNHTSVQVTIDDEMIASSTHVDLVSCDSHCHLVFYFILTMK